MKATVVTVIAAVVSGCAVTVPVAVISERDGTLRGSATATMSEGTFRVSNEKVTCTGSYDSMNSSPTLETVVQCSDGRRGFAVVTRTTLTSGHGTIRMSDGSTANLIFSNAAAAF